MKFKSSILLSFIFIACSAPNKAPSQADQATGESSSTPATVLMDDSFEIILSQKIFKVGEAINLSWRQVEGADSYEARISSDKDCINSTMVSSGLILVEELSTTLKGFEPGTNYICLNYTKDGSLELVNAKNSGLEISIVAE